MRQYSTAFAFLMVIFLLLLFLLATWPSEDWQWCWVVDSLLHDQLEVLFRKWKCASFQDRQWKREAVHKDNRKKITGRTSPVVVQGLRIHPPMQGTWIRPLVQEDSTCHGATNPMCHNYWACLLWSPWAAATEACLPRAHAPQQEKPSQWGPQAL